MSNNYSTKEIDFREFKCVKLYPTSGYYEQSLHKDEARKILEEKGFKLTEDDPYILNANEEFNNLDTLESIAAFVFFLA